MKETHEMVYAFQVGNFLPYNYMLRLAVYGAPTLRHEPGLLATRCRGFLLEQGASEGQAVMNRHRCQHGEAEVSEYCPGAMW